MSSMGFSERLACRVAGQHRTAQRHVPAARGPGDPDADVRAWLRDCARAHPRWGHRRAYHDARGEGWVVYHKRMQRLWCEEGLRVPHRRRRTRAGTTTAPISAAVKPDDVWAQTSSSARPPIVARSRSCRSSMSTPARALAAWSRATSPRALTDEHDRIVATRETGPIVWRSDNGPEFACTAMADWAGARTGLWFIPPGKPWRNGYIESFNGRLRDEFRNINEFRFLDHALVVISD